MFLKCLTFIPYNNFGNFMRAAKKQSRSLYTHIQNWLKVSGLRTKHYSYFAGRISVTLRISSI